MTSVAGADKEAEGKFGRGGGRTGEGMVEVRREAVARGGGEGTTVTSEVVDWGRTEVDWERSEAERRERRGGREFSLSGGVRSAVSSSSLVATMAASSSAGGRATHDVGKGKAASSSW